MVCVDQSWGVEWEKGTVWVLAGEHENRSNVTWFPASTLGIGAAGV